jgi:hypothetical protein
MRPLRRYCVAIALLLCSSGLAIAAGATARDQHTVVASDNLVLTGSQESLIWRKVAQQRAAADKAASSFTPSLWGSVPASMTLRPLPANVTSQIPMLRPYRYTTLGNSLLLVNPSDRRVVDIITP